MSKRRDTVYFRPRGAVLQLPDCAVRDADGRTQCGLRQAEGLAALANEIALEGYVFHTGQNNLFFFVCQGGKPTNFEFWVDFGKIVSIVSIGGTIMQNNTVTPGLRLRNLRKTKGLTQIKLAATLSERYEIGIDNRSICSYEKNINTPPPQTYELLADFFDVSLDYLRCLTNEPKPKLPAIINPEVLEFSERLSSLPNGLIRAVIAIADRTIEEVSRLDGEMTDRLAGLRARMVTQRGEAATLEWEHRRGISLPHSSSESP